MKNLFLIVIAVFVFSGCAALRYQSNVDSWIGHNSSELVAAWGQPSIIHEAQGGGSVYQYNRGVLLQNAGYTLNVPYYTNEITTANVYGSAGYAAGNMTTTKTNYNQINVPPTTQYAQCVTMFTTNASGIIIKNSVFGDGCVA